MAGGEAASKWARGDRQTHFGVFNFWILRGSLYKGPQKAICPSFFHDFLAGGEAALAADLITAWKTLRGGCASSRLDHGRTDGGKFQAHAKQAPGAPWDMCKLLLMESSNSLMNRLAAQSL